MIDGIRDAPRHSVIGNRDIGTDPGPLTVVRNVDTPVAVVDFVVVVASVIGSDQNAPTDVVDFVVVDRGVHSFLLNLNPDRVVGSNEFPSGIIVVDRVELHLGAARTFQQDPCGGRVHDEVAVDHDAG